MDRHARRVAEHTGRNYRVAHQRITELMAAHPHMTRRDAADLIIRTTPGADDGEEEPE
ncbi:hypothetical protein [Streptomyces sp. NPDC056242]|uniref:hypothetical protein n=1 Tax=unclassified Streptomyces TaxID=2593676 RepID=UPI0035E21000